MTQSFITKSIKVAAVTAVATLFTVSSSSAASFKFDGWASGYEVVNVGEPNYIGAAGAFEMKDMTTSESFVVFCLDIIGVIYSNVTYDYAATDTPFGTSTDLVLNGGVERLQKLFNSGYATALDSAVASAGFQVALWDAVYDDNMAEIGGAMSELDWSVDDGKFLQLDGNSAVKASANNYLAAAQGYTGPNLWNLTFLEGQNTNTNLARSQNLVTVSAVPVPASSLLLLSAFGGLMVARRRKSVQR